MDTEILNLAKDQKIADFADRVKSELKKKVMDNEYIKTQSSEMEKYSRISDALNSLSSEETTSETTDVPEETVDAPTEETTDVSPEEVTDSSEETPTEEPVETDDTPEASTEEN